MLRSMVVTPDGQFIFAANRDHSLLQFGLKFGEVMREFENVHCRYVLISSPCSNFLFISGKDRALHKWSIKHQKVMKTFTDVHEDIIACAKISPDGKIMYTSSNRY